jgi:hypothetical protein
MLNAAVTASVADICFIVRKAFQFLCPLGQLFSEVAGFLAKPDRESLGSAPETPASDEAAPADVNRTIY